MGEIKTVDETIKVLNKKYSGSVTKMDKESVKNTTIEAIPTGCFAIDNIFGCGGLPRGRMIEIFGQESCQPADSKVLMADGSWKFVQDIKIGDIVISPQRNGTNLFSKVLHTTKWKSLETFNLLSVRNKSNILYSCSGNHIVPFEGFIEKKMARIKSRQTFRCLKELTAKELSLLKDYKTQRYSTFTSFKIEKFINSKKIDIPAYALGVLLGDGSLSKKWGTVITSIDEPIINKLELLGGKFSVGHKKGTDAKSYKLYKNHSWNNWLMKNKLIGTNSHSKFIPSEAMVAVADYRLELLAGLIDTDGSLCKTNKNGSGNKNIGHYDYSTTSKKLADDISFIVHSLGGYCICSERFTKCNNKKFKSYRLYISLEEKLPVMCKRKTVNYEKGKTSPRNHGFTVQKKKGSMVYGFTLDSPSQWYITDNYFITHNSGKSTMALFFVATVQKAGGRCVWIDAEFAFSNDHASKIGVKVEDLIISKPETGEEALDTVDKMASTGEIDLIVVDSVAAMVPEKELQGEITDLQMALQARMMGKGLRMIAGNLSKTKTVVIFINQLRDKVGVIFGKKETTPGGKALKFFASVRIEVKKGKNIIENEEVIGNWIKMCGVKNKVGFPFREAEFELHYLSGIDVEGVAFDEAVKNEVIVKTGNTYNYKDIKLGVGRDTAKQYFKNNKEVLDGVIEELKK